MQIKSKLTLGKNFGLISLKISPVTSLFVSCPLELTSTGYLRRKLRFIYRQRSRFNAFRLPHFHVEKSKIIQVALFICLFIHQFFYLFFFAQEFKYFNETRPIQWIGGKLPLAEPICGFFGEKCISKTDWRLIGSALFVSVVLLVAAMFALKWVHFINCRVLIPLSISVKFTLIISLRKRKIKKKKTTKARLMLYKLSNLISQEERDDGRGSVIKIQHQQIIAAD